MIIIDTSVWIEFFRLHEPFHGRVSELIEQNEIMALSFVFGELLQGAKNETEREVIMEFWRDLPKIDEQGIFIRAGLESSKHALIQKGVGLIDTAIVCASRETGCLIWTLNKNLLGILHNQEKMS
jgi:predicted nucleic acid-binding protein